MIQINQNGCKCYGMGRIKEAFNFSISVLLLQFSNMDSKTTGIENIAEKGISHRALNLTVK